MSRVLLVEDHERLARLVSTGLATVGIAADAVPGADAAWAALQQVAYGALVLDRGLPDGDGLALLKRLRQGGLGVPCLVLTARDALHDRVEGLDAGSTLSVRDWGPGVPLDQLAHIFRRFWRGPHRRDQGAGLGLAICQEIALAHGWALAAYRADPGLRAVLSQAVPGGAR